MQQCHQNQPSHMQYIYIYIYTDMHMYNHIHIYSSEIVSGIFLHNLWHERAGPGHGGFHTHSLGRCRKASGLKTGHPVFNRPVDIDDMFRWLPNFDLKGVQQHSNERVGSCTCLILLYMSPFLEIPRRPSKNPAFRKGPRRTMLQRLSCLRLKTPGVRNGSHG